MTPPSASSKPAFSRLVVAGLAAVAAAVVVNLATLFILRPALGLNPQFMPFSPAAVAFFTALYAMIGWLVYVIVSRFVKNPDRVYWIIAIAALLLSLIPNLTLMANPAGAAMPLPGAPGESRDYAVLMIFHVTAFLAFVPTLLKMARR